MVDVKDFNGFMNELNEVDDIVIIIKEYEKVGYFENETHVLLVDNNKFHFRNKINDEKSFIEYVIYEDNYDSNYSDDELDVLNLCLEQSCDRGFELEY